MRSPLRKPGGRRRTIKSFETMTSEQTTKALCEFITKDDVSSLLQVSNRTVSELMAAK